MSGTVAPNLVAAVSEQRQWDRLMAMARLGAITGADGSPGVNRPCLSPLDREARRLLIGWGAAIGLAPSVDALGNLFLRLEGSEPGLAPVLTGSHMDSQPAGGRFDGIWGVIAGLEAIQALREAGITPRRPIELVAWTNEEGGRFAPGCMGSMAYAGHSAPGTWDAVEDGEGIRFGEALREQLSLEADLPRRPLGVTHGQSRRRAPGDPDHATQRHAGAEATAPAAGPAPHAYVEAHIEQGPRLETEGFDIGVVTGIQGSRWFLVELRGESAHAGTAPLSTRRDAVQDMLRAITALNALMDDPTDVLRFTVARIEVHPNSSNSVAERVRFTIDFRHPSAAVLAERGDAIEATIRGAVRHCEVVVTERFHALPVEFAPLVTEAVSRAAAAQGLRALRMPSGAFHDAQFMVPLCPSGMIFVPSRKGISHNPAEYSSPAQLAAGARVLAQVLHKVAEE